MNESLLIDLGVSAFRCGHPREGNSIPSSRIRKDGTRVPMCALCTRIRSICRNARRTQQRINEGRYTRGERIADIGTLRGRGA